MSEIGNYYLELQEQANELGYETVEEAIDDGCKVDISKQKLITPLEQKIDDEKIELEKAHEAWLKEKEEVIKGLKGLLDLWSDEYTNYELAYVLSKSQETIGKAIEFIKRGEI